jgi:hypothetical protein
MEILSRYIIRASFSQERMSYTPDESRVVYRSKDGKEEKIFDALEWPRQKRRDAPRTGCKHTRSLCALMSRTKANRWLGIMAITRTWLVANGKNRIRTA